MDEGRVGVADVEGNGAWWEKVLVGSAKPAAVERSLMRSVAVAEEEATETGMVNAQQGLVWSMRNGGEVRQAEHGRAWKGGRKAEEDREECGEQQRARGGRVEGDGEQAKSVKVAP